jgi:hypothetical protein
MIKFFRVLGIVGVAGILLCGCANTQTRSSVIPRKIICQGAYVHAGSQIVMPEEVTGYRRVAVLRYDNDGLDISAGYDLVNSSNHVAATVYVYPGPSMIAIGSPLEVVTGTKAELTEQEFAKRKQEIAQAHPGARLMDQGDIQRTEKGQMYTGRFAEFQFDTEFAFSQTTVRSRLYVFCFVGGKWAVEYRFTYPKSENADEAIQKFIDNWHWFGTAN